MWIRSRQFTGRIVTVTNDQIFSEPVYNYTDQFPYLWDEIRLPIHYYADHQRVEAILRDAARRHAVTCDKVGHEEVARLEQKFGIDVGEIDPLVYWRITDNWLELTVRFLCPDHGSRRIKDAMSREILTQMLEAKIGVASSSMEIAGAPKLQFEMLNSREQ
ncbi:MAG: mechanosensitive ion channel family protein [Novosphingobium sp.]|nr:mechanosensitive ion channel family protein [Novosphingobium sp.]